MIHYRITYYKTDKWLIIFAISKRLRLRNYYKTVYYTTDLFIIFPVQIKAKIRRNEIVTLVIQVVGKGPTWHDIRIYFMESCSQIFLLERIILQPRFRTFSIQVSINTTKITDSNWQCLEKGLANASHFRKCSKSIDSYKKSQPGAEDLYVNDVTLKW